MGDGDEGDVRWTRVEKASGGPGILEGHGEALAAPKGEVLKARSE
jgi:hypothetical protein